MEIVCLDLEGVLVPEIWINFAKRTGIKELEATTRDIPDYDVLMKQRLRILDEHKLGLNDIQAVIAEMGPIARRAGVCGMGARAFSTYHSFRHLLRVCSPSDASVGLAHHYVSQA
jgi:bifunctional phosphoserine phosphatase/homoserine phosphotransferase